MAHFITIAGPQSSGKTMTMEYLKGRHPDWQFIDEVNPSTILNSQNAGLIDANTEIERKISDKDIEIIKNINKDRNVFFECGITHYTYISYFLPAREAEEYFKKYLDAHRGLSPIVFFIDTKPGTSWERRKNIYLERLEKQNVKDKSRIEAVLSKQKEMLFKMYPHWLECYEKIPYPKLIIENMKISKQVFLDKIENIIQSLISRGFPR